MTASKQTRVGIIGAGYIATWHADAIKATTGAQLVAVCDQSKGVAEDLARAHGVQAFGSVDDMIAASVCDAVHILTPPSSHRDLTLQALRAGLHVLVEKPVSLSGDEAEEMRVAAIDAGKVLAAGHNFLGLLSYERLKAMMQRGDLGRVSSVQINWALPLAVRAPVTGEGARALQNRLRAWNGVMVPSPPVVLWSAPAATCRAARVK